jgi:hypothetical protein
MKIKKYRKSLTYSAPTDVHVVEYEGGVEGCDGGCRNTAPASCSSLEITLSFDRVVVAVYSDLMAILEQNPWNRHQ